MRAGFSMLPGFDVPFRWEKVLDSTNATWPFSQAGKRIARELSHRFRGPQVYRFAFYDQDCRLTSVYIGEAGCFLKRHTHYKPKALSEDFVWKRYRQGKVSWKIAGTKEHVELHLLVLNEFRLNQVVIDQASLSSPFVRRLLENLAICQSEAEAVHVLNRGRDQEMKMFISRLKKSRSSRANAAQR